MGMPGVTNTSQFRGMSRVLTPGHGLISLDWPACGRRLVGGAVRERDQQAPNLNKIFPLRFGFSECLNVLEVVER